MIPCAADCKADACRQLAQRLWSATRKIELLEFAPSKEANRAAVRRPERKAGKVLRLPIPVKTSNELCEGLLHILELSEPPAEMEFGSILMLSTSVFSK